MRLLLDTHAFLWFVEDDALLSATARTAIEDPDAEVFLSVASRPDSGRWDLKRLTAGAADDEKLAATGLDAWADALDAEDRRRGAERSGGLT